MTEQLAIEQLENLERNMVKALETAATFYTQGDFYAAIDRLKKMEFERTSQCIKVSKLLGEHYQTSPEMELIQRRIKIQQRLLQKKIHEYYPLLIKKTSAQLTLLIQKEETAQQDMDEKQQQVTQASDAHDKILAIHQLFVCIKNQLIDLKGQRERKTITTEKHHHQRDEIRGKLNKLISENHSLINLKSEQTKSLDSIQTPQVEVKVLLPILEEILRQLNTMIDKAKEKLTVIEKVKIDSMSAFSQISSACTQEKEKLRHLKEEQINYPDPDEVALAEAKKLEENRVKLQTQQQREKMLQGFDFLLIRLKTINSHLAAPPSNGYQSTQANRDYALAAVAGERLYTNLSQHRKAFVVDQTIDIVRFKEECETSMNTETMSVFTKHPGYTELVYEIAFWVASILSLGIIPLISYHKTGNFKPSFFQVPKAETVDIAEQFQVNLGALG